jgi:hypothetical protein
MQRFILFFFTFAAICREAASRPSGKQMKRTLVWLETTRTRADAKRFVVLLILCSFYAYFSLQVSRKQIMLEKAE